MEDCPKYLTKMEYLTKVLYESVIGSLMYVMAYIVTTKNFKNRKYINFPNKEIKVIFKYMFN